MCLGGAHCEFWARKTARVEATPTASFACRELRPVCQLPSHDPFHNDCATQIYPA